MAAPGLWGLTAVLTPNLRYPDPSVEVLDDALRDLRQYSASVEQLFTGCRWAEGRVWFGDGRYLLLSDIPNNRILRPDDASGATSVFRAPADNANGHTRDRQGRRVSCEHLARRITRTEYDGRITVLADRFDGKRLNSPSDPHPRLWAYRVGTEGAHEAPVHGQQPFALRSVRQRTGRT